MGIIAHSYNIKKNDKVMVVTGKEKGRTGKVLRVIRKKDQIIVEKINFVKRHSKPTKKVPQGGIIEKEAPINISNVMFLCGKCNSPVRIGHKVLEDGTKVRVCRKCGETIEA